MTDQEADDDSNREDDFSYDGNLVFNGIYRTETDGFGDIALTENIDPYSKGTYPHPNEGYIELEETSYDLSSIGDQMSSTIKRLNGFKYKFDSWKSSEVETDDGLSERPVYDPQSFDVYCYDPDYIFLRGPKTAIKQKRATVLSDLPSGLSPDEVQFNSDFLLWILYKCMKGEALNSTVSVRRLPNCETTGERDNVGEGIKVRGSDNVERSVPILVTFLEDKEISSIRGYFVVGTSFVVADIDIDGSVRIRTSHEQMEDLSQLRRVSVSLRFLSEFVDLYDEWQDLPADEKYPDDIFRIVYEISLQEGYKPTIKPTEQIEQYEQKRRDERVGDES